MALEGLATTVLPWWVYLVMLWTLIWKGIGLWKSGRNNQLPWFIAMLVLNTAGILPIIYLVWFQRKFGSKNAGVRGIEKRKDKPRKSKRKSKK
jgi:hypothetical protein